MSQTTLNGEETSIKAPYSSLSPNERRIYRFLRTLGAGRTEKQIHERFPDIATIGNRLRSLRQKGWARSWKPYPNVDQLWYAIERGES